MQNLSKKFHCFLPINMKFKGFRISMCLFYFFHQIYVNYLTFLSGFGFLIFSPFWRDWCSCVFESVFFVCVFFKSCSAFNSLDVFPDAHDHASSQIMFFLDSVDMHRIFCLNESNKGLIKNVFLRVCWWLKRKEEDKF